MSESFVNGSLMSESFVNGSFMDGSNFGRERFNHSIAKDPFASDSSMSI